LRLFAYAGQIENWSTYQPSGTWHFPKGIAILSSTRFALAHIFKGGRFINFKITKITFIIKKLKIKSRNRKQSDLLSVKPPGQRDAAGHRPERPARGNF
jgi:hypothetical protein